MPILKEPKALWQTCCNRQPVPEVSEGRAGLQGSKLIGYGPPPQAFGL
jgi:hypothetical protein